MSSGKRVMVPVTGYFDSAPFIYYWSGKVATDIKLRAQHSFI